MEVDQESQQEASSAEFGIESQQQELESIPLPPEAVVPSDANTPRRKKKGKPTLRKYQKCSAANKSVMNTAKLLCCNSCKRLDGPDPLVCDHCFSIICSNCILYQDPPKSWQLVNMMLLRSEIPQVKLCPNCKKVLSDDTVSQIPCLAGLQLKARQLIRLRLDVDSNILDKNKV